MKKTREIVKHIGNKDFNAARQEIRQELYNRSKSAIEAMKPSVMSDMVKSEESETLDEKKYSSGDTVSYKGYKIKLHQNKGGKWTAKNDSGEPYNDVPQFKTPDEAIKWDKKNIDQMED